MLRPRLFRRRYRLRLQPPREFFQRRKRWTITPRAKEVPASAGHLDVERHHQLPTRQLALHQTAGHDGGPHPGLRRDDQVHRQVEPWPEPQRARCTRLGEPALPVVGKVGVVQQGGGLQCVWITVPLAQSRRAHRDELPAQQVARPDVHGPSALWPLDFDPQVHVVPREILVVLELAQFDLDARVFRPERGQPGHEPLDPDVPTFSELKLPDLNLTSGTGLAAPARTPDAIRPEALPDHAEGPAGPCDPPRMGRQGHDGAGGREAAGLPGRNRRAHPVLPAIAQANHIILE